jgi:hypothetical protein
MTIRTGLISLQDFTELNIFRKKRDKYKVDKITHTNTIEMETAEI